MKTLILVRHAKSSWDEPHLRDFDRPLNGRGKRDAPRMARYLADIGIHADLLVSSPANRAITTAKAIAGGQPGNPEVIEEPRLFHAGASEILRVINEQPDSATTLMIFGHNPGFTDAANLLCDGDIDNIPTCGVVGVGFDVARWSAVEFGAGQQLYFYFPKGI